MAYTYTLQGCSIGVVYTLYYSQKSSDVQRSDIPKASTPGAHRTLPPFSIIYSSFVCSWFLTPQGIRYLRLTSNLLWSQGWPGPPSPPTSASCKLGLQACTSTPSSTLWLLAAQIMWILLCKSAAMPQGESATSPALSLSSDTSTFLLRTQISNELSGVRLP